MREPRRRERGPEDRRLPRLPGHHEHRRDGRGAERQRGPGVGPGRRAEQPVDALDGAVTGCAIAIAETGTFVLDASDDVSGRRALTLVPDLHVCVVRAEHVVPDVPDAVALLDSSRPLTWISGPSATRDIELDRVEGVHGPRELVVVLVD